MLSDARKRNAVGCIQFEATASIALAGPGARSALDIEGDTWILCAACRYISSLPPLSSS
jgi:hypothetical protein